MGEQDDDGAWGVDLSERLHRGIDWTVVARLSRTIGLLTETLVATGSAAPDRRTVLTHHRAPWPCADGQVTALVRRLAPQMRTGAAELACLRTLPLVKPICSF